MEKISTNLIKLAETAKINNEKVYIVGGFIRNYLLKSYKTDIDLCGTMSTQEICKIAGSVGFSSQVVNEKLGTVLLTGFGEQYEYTPFRRDEYEKGGFHTPTKVEFVKDLEVDVARRDFTINTLYYDIVENKLIDIFNGQKDIKHKLIKCIVSPKHVFSSDGLRILRLIRFASELDLNIERETFKSAKKYSYQLKDISKERIVKELKLMVVSETRNDYDAKAHVKAIKLLNSLGLWKYILNYDFKKFKVVTRGEVFKMYKNCKPENRFNALICLIFYSIFKSFKFNDQLIEFYLNIILGVEGFKLQKSIPNIRNLIFVLRELTSKPKSSVYNYNKLCIMYENLSDDNKNIIRSGFDMMEIEQNIDEMQSQKIPFKQSDLAITSKELMELKIANKNLKKVYNIITFEIVSMSLKNNKQQIIDFIKNNLTEYITK